MSNTETLAVSSQIESHELRAWPASSSRVTISEHAIQTPEMGIPTENEHEISQLAPVDGGVAAWRLLGAAFVFETLLWGFPLSFGVFQDYYSRIPAFSSSPYIGVVGTIASGLGYIGAPFIMPFIQIHQRWRRQMIWVGWPICIGGLVAGSFANTLETLILTQGVAYGIGFLILYYPILMMVNEYWIARRGMAYGLLCGASGVSGAVMPFVVQALLSTYGYQTTLRAVAVGLAVLTGPLIPFLDGRLPPSAHVNTPKTNWSFFKSPLFWLYSVSNLFQGFGYFFPSLYLPSFATSLDLGERSGPILLAVMSVSQVAGQFVFGYLSDRKLPLDVLACSSTLVAAVTTLTMWRVADSFPVLIGFTILYGFFGAGFTAIWARMSTTITDDVTAAPIVFGLLNFGKGVGNVLAGPIGGLLVYNSSSLQQSSAAESLIPSSYRWVIIFTGSFESVVDPMVTSIASLFSRLLICSHVERPFKTLSKLFSEHQAQNKLSSILGINIPPILLQIAISSSLNSVHPIPSSPIPTYFTNQTKITDIENARWQTDKMKPSDIKSWTESPTSLGRDDNTFDEALLSDDDWKTVLEEPIAGGDEMVSVDAKRYAAFQRWEASQNKSLNPKEQHVTQGKIANTSQDKKDTKPSQLDIANWPLPRWKVDGKEVRAWCNDIERKMKRLGVRGEDRGVFKHSKMLEIKEKNPWFYRLTEQVNECANQMLADPGKVLDPQPAGKHIDKKIRKLQRKNPKVYRIHQNMAEEMSF
ncbi:hypothetical protein BFJ70_g853 [Fusarium oxysporum]|nr:hypothetical protein BFJ70_g853 [Fusarium oxysporum]